MEQGALGYEQSSDTTSQEGANDRTSQQQSDPSMEPVNP
jgi:hypothetical protein